MLQHDRQLRAICTNIEKKIKQELKKLLAVYYGQSISVDPYPDYDGQQWE